MQEQYYAIGEAAGKIYKALEKEGEITGAKLQKAASVTDTALFNQAIGWLARESNISLKKSGRSVKVSLTTVNA